MWRSKAAAALAARSTTSSSGALRASVTGRSGLLSHTQRSSIHSFQRLPKTSSFLPSSSASSSLSLSSSPSSSPSSPSSASYSTTSSAVHSRKALENQVKYANVLRYIEAYRSHGHLQAQLDPLHRQKQSSTAEKVLEASLYGVDKLPGDAQIPLEGLLHIEGKTSATVEEITAHLRATYCRHIGAELSHLEEPEEQAWLAEQLEKAATKKFSSEERKSLFQLLQHSEAFDHFLQTKFNFVKRYGLEGCEAMVPCLDTIFSSATQQADVKDIVISMPHRGRLNFLVGPLKYPAGHIFRKIKGLSEAPEQTSNYKGTGDVLSHIGQSVDLEYGGKKVHVSLIHNPSHLEAANPVAMGKARAKLEHNADPSSALCIMIHGDAAFPAQGVVAETFLLSQLADFTVGGAVHVVVNNQVGFTTEPHKGRSSRYCSDIGKMVNTPALHVNAEDPESVVLAASIATAYRNKFKKDIILDLIGYRRYGHNELDEPSFTQPTMYSHIRSRPSVVKNYAERLISDNVIRSEDVQSGKDAINKEFEQEYAVSDKEMPGLTWLEGKWKTCKEASDMTAPVDTGVSTDVLLEVGESSINTHGKNIHSRLQNHYCKPRKTKLESQGKIDWATAEALAVGSLLLQDYNVRFCGQDVGRGTFSHRHFRLVDQKTDEFVIPLNHIRPTQQGRLSVVDSPLSELAVMGFEYGYSLEDPKTLPIWEAQFGDFSNTAQVTIDQFISSSEEKWWRQTGMVLLLPHGFDGAGPEHSSCRMERYLQACNTADSVEQEQEHNRVVNMSVVYPSTPANYFHLLRRQMVREYRKPLVVVGPKTMLRHPAVVSELADMAPGTHFLPVLPDTSVDPSQVEKVVFCTGKLYYDLAKERESKGLKDTALVRVEEFSPFPYHLLSQQIQSFGNARSFKWVQEEPQNMGAWSYVRPRLNSLLARESKAEAELSYVGRPPAGAPAVGISALHKQQVSHIMEKCFA